MGYARDAKLEVMKANVRTGQSAYAYALTKYEDEKNEVTQKKLIGEEVCKNMNGIACYYFEPPSMFCFSPMECSYIYAYEGYKDMWSCSVNGTYIQTDVEK